MQLVAWGEASQVLWCPHRDTSVPAGDVNVRILNAGGGEVLSGVTATVGTLSTTISSAATAGARTITVADETGARVGDPVVITDAQGRSEVHTIDGATTNTISIRDRLSRDYAIGATVISAAVYYTLDASSTSTYPADAYYQALFENSNWTAERAILFRVVDFAHDESPIRYEDLRRWIPHASALRDSYDDADLDEARDTAWEILRTRIEASRRDPEVWRGEERIRSVGGLLAAGLFALSHGHDTMGERLIGVDPPGDGGLFAAHWENTIRTLGWFDTAQDRGVDRGEVDTLSTYRVRRGL
jgi:hypothetical protein